MKLLVVGLGLDNAHIISLFNITRRRIANLYARHPNKMLCSCFNGDTGGMNATIWQLLAARLLSIATVSLLCTKGRLDI